MGGGEESSGSASNDPGSSKNLSLVSPTPAGGLESVPSAFLDVKGKGVLLGGRPASVLRRRRRRRRTPLSRRGRSPSAWPSPPLQLGWQEEGSPSTPFTVDGQVQRAMSEESGDDRYVFDEFTGLVEGTASPTVEKDVLASAKEVCGSEGNFTSVIRNLQWALKKEQSFHVVLSLELEKERNAAATAADEAMAMILRLQKEKADIEMEARQYRNIVEEKSAYDEEEMVILKEIIVRREREKHVLEKEVKAYQQMLLNGGEQHSDCDLQDITQLMGQRPGGSFDPSDDPITMLQQIYESIEKKEKVNSMFQQVSDCGPSVAERQSFTTGFGNESLSLSLDENVGYSSHESVEKDDIIEGHHEEVPAIGDKQDTQFQEKGMGTIQDLCKLKKSQERGFDEVITHFINEDVARIREIEIGLPLDKLYVENGQTSNQRGGGVTQFETEVCIHDVHVIDDKTNWEDKGNEKEVDLSQIGCASGTSGDGNVKTELCGVNSVNHTTNNSVTRWTNGELNICRSSSDMTMGEQSLLDKASCFDLRRHSVSAVDYERYMLENEVEQLRKRLKIIQQGREQLSFSVEHKENESDHLLLLGEISHQQEIGQVTKPEKSVRRASLPPISSKGSKLSQNLKGCQEACYWRWLVSSKFGSESSSLASPRISLSDGLAQCRAIVLEEGYVEEAEHRPISSLSAEEDENYIEGPSIMPRSATTMRRSGSRLRWSQASSNWPKHLRSAWSIYLLFLLGLPRLLQQWKAELRQQWRHSGNKGARVWGILRP